MRSSTEENIGSKKASKGQRTDKSPYKAVKSKIPAPTPKESRFLSHAFTSPIHRRCVPESILDTTDEVICNPKGAKSDPVGKEQDLSSGGPLDDGVAPSLVTPTRKPIARSARSVGEFGANQDTTLHFHVAASTRGQLYPSNDSQRGVMSFSKSHEHYSSSSIPATGQSRQRGVPKLTMDGVAAYNPVVVSSSPESAASLPLGSPFEVIPHPGGSQILFRSSSDADSSVDNGGVSESDDQSSAMSTHAADPAIISRRAVRSHTTQGIPIHMLHAIKSPATKAPKEAAEQDFYSVEGSLKTELVAYRNLAQHLEEQVMTLTMLLDDERRKINNLSNNAASLGMSMDPSWFSPSSSQLNRRDSLPDTPNSGAIPSLTMSPDPFSPFQQLTPSTSYPGTPASAMYRQACVYDSERHNGGSMQVLAGDHSSKDAEPYSYLSGLHFDVGALDCAPAFQFQEDKHASEAPGSTIDTKPGYLAPERVTMCQEGSISGEMPQSYPSYFCGMNNSYDHRNWRKYPMEHVNVTTEVLIARALGTRSQEPSILLQQQLKCALPAQKADIIRGITPHLLQLSEDKHGNFLVQRAVGVDSNLAWRLRGSFLKLSLSQFGCHVVLKVLEGEEEISKKVVEELLSAQVDETLTSRNAVHIWQKIFEIRWTDNDMRSRIFRVVNDTMRGRWTNTAMLETGSIICQNIFESADASEKRECLSEILERLCDCGSNQWGVWVVQHIIEHSEKDAQSAALKKLLNNAVELTLSQYGQKAIMSALKTQNGDFLTSYVNLLCDRDPTTNNGRKGSSNSASPMTRRTSLVDVAVLPQGVLIVTQLLTSVTPALRARIINTVRRNSVFLKSTKSGLNVHRLCERARAYSGY